MSAFSLLAWSAWAPGLTTRDAWQEWAQEPLGIPNVDVSAPELPFIPPMQRRRMGSLTKMALRVAYDGCPPELLSQVPTVFASRHGEVHACAALLRDIARDSDVSPTTFSHSVHNTAAGLFSIAAVNAAPSTSVAANRSTFCTGLIEALGLSLRQGQGPVLLVTADDPLPTIFASFADESSPAYALALLISLTPRESAPRLRIEAADLTQTVTDEKHSLPQALCFLAWLLGHEATLTLDDRSDFGWTFTRSK